ncbi:FliH/SctL family protein [Citricoccus sp. GCM10030269]|uniref:FliH/SctL family protein n=1 Tax=Citricoccus sp. GCM10030269 TaxID=3273388 RepID=UPI003622FC43
MSELIAHGHPGQHETRSGGQPGYRPEYRAVPATVVSSPVVDAAVIEGRARGYVDGLKAAQGHADALEDARQAEHERLMRSTRERTEQALTSLERAAVELSASMVHALDNAEDTIFEVACQVAEIILDAELSDASVAARSAIHRALSTPTPSPVHTIRLHPAAVRVVTQAGQPPAGVVLQEDHTLPPGGAVAEYDDGWLEAGLEDALARVGDYAARLRRGSAAEPAVGRAAEPADGSTAVFSGEVAR